MSRGYRAQLPPPPRPQLEPFGLSVYHGKEIWKRLDLVGRTAAPKEIIRQRMARDWGVAGKKIASVLA